jgi:uncharacterized lipoprotein YehR (DUF1307 family)
MQSNQSKLLLAGLVAAQAATALEINESHLVAVPQASELAQVNQTLPPPANGNLLGDPTAEELAAANPPNVPSSTELMDKIMLLNKANIQGLDAKLEHKLKDLKAYRQESVDTLKTIDAECRIKTDAAKQLATETLAEAKLQAFADLKKCRTDYVDQLLTRKEELKGDLEQLLNESIHDIKNMKVEQILNENGLPTS